MVQINNPEIIKNLIKAAKISLEEVGKVPNQLAEKIIAVLNINTAPEKLIQIKVATASDAAAATIHTTSSTKTTYLTGFYITVTKDAVSDSLFTQLTVAPFGKADTTIGIIRYEPTTANNHYQLFTFSEPIKLEKNAAIAIKNNTATASIDSGGIIYYYEVDD